jgi:very-short-patch-repair endonuclease
MWFSSTRSPGGVAAAKSFFRNDNKSKFEIKIHKALRRLKIKNKKFFTPCNDHRVANKINFIHDFYLEDYNMIIEYNGSHWHQDISSTKNKNKYCINDYIKSIIRAKISIELKRKRKIKYLLIWENDVNNDLGKALRIIKDAIESKNSFISTRKIDYIIYNHVI